MRKYEIMYIMPPDFDSEKTEAVIQKYSDILTAEGGEIIEINKWGKRKLAYEIDKTWKEGFYVLMTFNAEPAAVNELDRKMKISDDIIRQMITRIEE